MKNIFIGLVVLLLLILGLIYLNSDERADAPSDTTQPQNNATNTSPSTNESELSEMPEGFYLHAEPAFQYTIAVPNEVDVSSPRSGITRYRYVGPQSEPNAEITDGYTITVNARTTNETSVNTLASQEIQRDRVTVLKEPSTEQLAGQTVSGYTTESEIGKKPIQHYTLLPDNGFGYIVSININPPEDSQYQEEVNTILESLTFLGEDRAFSLESRIIPIAMLDYGAVDDSYVKESGGQERGCDKVVIIGHVLQKDTTTPLNASLRQLFRFESDTVGGWQNFVASQNDTLSFDYAEINAGNADIYLTGELGPLGGVCDNPRTAIQIEETALAYPTVDSVQIYLNGEPTNLIPSGRGE